MARYKLSSADKKTIIKLAPAEKSTRVVAKEAGKYYLLFTIGRWGLKYRLGAGKLVSTEIYKKKSCTFLFHLFHLQKMKQTSIADYFCK